MNLLLDTDVLIFFLRGDRRVKKLLQCNDRFYCSTITRKELLGKAGLMDRERKAIHSLLSRLRLIPVDQGIAAIADKIHRKYNHRGLQIPDALIAATAMDKKLTLVSYNQKHFCFIEGLTLLPARGLDKL